MIAIVRPMRPWKSLFLTARKWNRWRQIQIAIVASTVLHGLIAVPLARWLLPERGAVSWRAIEFRSAQSLPPEPIETLELSLLPTLVMRGTPLVPDLVDVPAKLPEPPQIAGPAPGQTVTMPLQVTARSDIDFVPLTIELPVSSELADAGVIGSDSLAQAKLVANTAGSPQCSAAIERGLAWLVAHQHADGGWRFDLHGGPCGSRCRNSGAERSTTAASGLSLLPLLNNEAEPYDANAVAAGLDYLRNRLMITRDGGDLREGTMYGQGLATLALARGLARTGDDSLREPTQQAALFIVHAQHPRGGWRYFPGQAGDITVVGWQVAALDAARTAGLAVPEETLLHAGEFLDSVQTDDGTAYGYQRPETQRSASAIGLACRMRLGWHPLDARIECGAEQLVIAGPSYDDMYFNHYAAFVVRESGSSGWPEFRERIVKHLLATQATSGHEAGSWHFADPHTSPGGRVCDTALALLILQTCVQDTNLQP